MWRSVGIFLRELFLALIGQPSRPAASAEEQATEAAQRAQLREARTPASAWDAARQLGAEAGKVAAGQPTPAPRRRQQD